MFRWIRRVVLRVRKQLARPRAAAPPRRAPAPSGPPPDWLALVEGVEMMRGEVAPVARAPQPPPPPAQWPSRRREAVAPRAQEPPARRSPAPQRGEAEPQSATRSTPEPSQIFPPRATSRQSAAAPNAWSQTVHEPAGARPAWREAVPPKLSLPSWPDLPADPAPRQPQFDDTAVVALPAAALPYTANASPWPELPPPVEYLDEPDPYDLRERWERAEAEQRGY